MTTQITGTLVELWTLVVHWCLDYCFSDELSMLLVSAVPGRTLRADLHRHFGKHCSSKRNCRLVSKAKVGVVGQRLPFAAQECAITYTEFVPAGV
jgi:hypothetical protein